MLCIQSSSIGSDVKLERGNTDLRGDGVFDQMHRLDGLEHERETCISIHAHVIKLRDDRAENSFDCAARNSSLRKRKLVNPDNDRNNRKLTKHYLLKNRQVILNTDC